jgi:electron transfer flavoprotein alpha subunit
MANVWVYAELANGDVHPAALELVSMGRGLGAVEAVALGPGAAHAADALGRHGARRVHASDAELFEDHPVAPAADTLAALVDRHRPDVVMVAATPHGRDVGGRLAGTLGVGAVANATALTVTDGSVVAEVPYCAGSQVASLRVDARPAIVLVRPRSATASEAPEAAGAVEVVEVEPVVRARATDVRVEDRTVEPPGQVGLERADVVVAGGRGLGSAEHYKLVEDLADALGGAAGASRAIVDAGWAPYSAQVGQTGKSVRPRVYLAAGISGALQHTAGMRDSKLVIAINTDRDAPMLRQADLGIVGDALTLLPRLIEAVRARQQPDGRAESNIL